MKISRQYFNAIHIFIDLGCISRYRILHEKKEIRSWMPIYSSISSFWKNKFKNY